MALTPEQKKDNRIARILGQLKCLQINRAKNKVATVFQQMIRYESAAANGGVLVCVTCGRKGRIGENTFDAGHFLPGRRASTIFHEQGCHTQCKPCNKGQHHGTVEKYERFMIEKYGEQFVEDFRKLHWEDHKFTHDQLAELQYGFEVRKKAAEKRLSE